MDPPNLAAKDLVDALLAAASHRAVRGVALTQEAASTTIEAIDIGGKRSLGHVPPVLGTAAISHLAHLAHVECPSGAIGRLRTSIAGVDVEYMVDAGPEQGDVRRVEVLRLSTAPGPEFGDDSTDHWMPPSFPYTIERQLGRGGMGVVYQAVHRNLERRVAIKVLRAHRAQREGDRFRFLREARAASRVRHPGVASVLDFGSLPDGKSYMVMELVEGDTLRTLLDRGPLPPLRAARIMRRMASAVEAAHAHGVIHRDLKPDNVFVLSDDQVKIVDFGAAKLLACTLPSETADGRVHGTPRYMAPEHAAGAATDRRTDVYALGSVLYEMLAGQPPYDDETPAALLYQHAHSPIPKVQLENAALGRALNRVIQRAMAKAPEARHPDARALERDLDRTIAAAEGGWWQRLRL